MSLLFAWQPPATARSGALAAFEARLAAERDAYAAAYGRAFSSRVHAAGRVFVGQVRHDDGVLGWTPWFVGRRGGVAWSGVAEEELDGELDDDRVERLFETIAGRPKSLRDWTGRFAVCAWHEPTGRTVLANGAAGGVTLWHTSGPSGWAIGSRARPLLDLVGRTPALDADAASLSVGFGYLVGSGALFAGVQRLESGERVVFESEAEPAVERYLSIGEFLGDGPPALPRARLVEEAAGRLAGRVGRQLEHSDDPAVLLSGGRDSRAIAAAAARSGFRGAARTSGSRDSRQVRVASDVAGATGLGHTTSETAARPATIRLLTNERAVLWHRLTEGIYSFEQAMKSTGFFAGQTPFPAARQQLFHGLAGEVVRGYYYPLGRNVDGRRGRTHGPAVIAGRVPPGLRLRRPIGPLLGDVLERFDAEVADPAASLARWLDLFYWRSRCLHWGLDALSVTDIHSWHWTPLLDRSLIVLAGALDARDKVSNRFIEEVTRALAPELGTIAYDKGWSMTRRWLVQQAKDVARLLGRRNRWLSLADPRHVRRPVDPHLAAFWTGLFFGPGDHTWPAVIDEEMLRYLLRVDPDSHLAWNVATIELFGRAHLR